ncbi:aspartate aminotransferase family protein [Amycolatopsis sp. BJA-103]|uniref:aminotransferase family protein n=1 Tax=Amycolatopsis sp. BJA-103 TaxID=1911175 RepID=UPI000C757930|nr:aminotransferase class III-fold pyridoxal phosphate-dependent enzyme [Amycolatopsis sp. BJA-103]AUI60412.1 hypothetical protein BKN51_20915 [Amycolatopsis sp. BJA-103]PNE16435.1 hypothetical protein B1H26_24550 [Amycolatopsis sp. BJA-103]
MTEPFGGLLYGDWDGTWPVITGGDGIFLQDMEGRKYLDAVGGSHVVTIGHGVAEIGGAMADQARQVAYASGRTFANSAQLELAELIRTRTPEGLNWLYFTSGGSEATEMAIQLARQYHVERGDNRRYKVIGRQHSYHGGTLGAVAVGGHAVHRSRLGPYLDRPHLIASPECLHCPLALTYPACELACAEDLARMIEAEDPLTVAAFIAEPIGGTTSGAMSPPAGYYEAIRAVCDQYGILFLADEVVTGFGRTGLDFAILNWRATPDIMICSKGITSGYAPLGAVIAHDDVAATIREGSGQVALRLTYSGNPVSCAAGLAVQRYVEKHDLVRRCAAMGKYLERRLAVACGTSRFLAGVRGAGLLLAVWLAQDPATGRPFPRAARAQERVIAEGMRRGIVLMGGTGTANSVEGDHILVSPPFTITELECDLLVELLTDTVSAALSDVNKERGR